MDPVDASKSGPFNLDAFIAQQRRETGNRSDLEPFCTLANEGGSFQPPNKFKEEYVYRPFPKNVQTPGGYVVVQNQEALDDLLAHMNPQFPAGGASSDANEGGSDDDEMDEAEERAKLIEALRAAGKSVQGLGNATIDTLRKKVADLGAGG